MRRHPLDLASLLAGLVLTGLAAVYLVASLTDHRLDAGWVLPIALVAAGLAGLAGGLTRAVNGTTPDSQQDPDPEPDTPGS